MQTFHTVISLYLLFVDCLKKSKKLNDFIFMTEMGLESQSCGPFGLFGFFSHLPEHLPEQCLVRVHPAESQGIGMAVCV